MKKRLALFFDGANHNEALTKSHVTLDYGKLMENLQRTYDVVSARYYTGLPEKENGKGLRDFLGAISNKGYVIITKPIRKFSDGTTKANVDIEIAVDMVTMAPKLDQVILFSGDGDFAYAVDTIQRAGVKVSVVSHKLFAALELRTQANEFVELADLAKTYNW